MKVLLVSHRYPPFGVAGVEHLAARTAIGLRRRGHEVTVLTRRPSPAPPTLRLERELRDGVPVVSVVGDGAEADSFPGQGEAMERVFERLLVETSADVVLVSHLLYHSPGYVDVAHRLGVPVVLELHDFFALCPRAHLRRPAGEKCGGPEGGRACAEHCFEEPAGERRWSRRASAFGAAVRRADQVVAPSRFLADAFAALRGPAAPIEVIGNGVAELGPVVRRKRDPGAPLDLFSIGVTVEHKGFHVAIDALRRAELPAARYTVLGEVIEPEGDRLRRAAEQVPGLELRLFGGFSPSLLPALLAAADLLVVPSLVEETYSIVLREAFACGVPVAGSRGGALPEAIRDGVDGWLFEPGDASALAGLLSRLDADRTLLARAAAAIDPAAVETDSQRLDGLERLFAAGRQIIPIVQRSI
jgi:glycosyltransferase involved in cell wall biosynthesis